MLTCYIYTQNSVCHMFKTSNTIIVCNVVLSLCSCPLWKLFPVPKNWPVFKIDPVLSTSNYFLYPPTDLFLLFLRLTRWRPLLPTMIEPLPWYRTFVIKGAMGERSLPKNVDASQSHKVVVDILQLVVPRQGI